MQIITVQQLTRHIKGILENSPQLNDLWIKGEVSNYKQAVSGHIYFTLKDNFSSVRVVMFRSRTRFLTCLPQNGMAVRIRGNISVYERDGQYQLFAEQIVPDGTGALFAALEKLKQQLSAEGLFDTARKKTLPQFPSQIGIVTSSTGAVLRDMIHILRRRWPVVHIFLASAAVQGAAAPTEIARALGRLNTIKQLDLIIVGRGGGSLEELWAFNTEPVVRAIAASQIPVISAVGHETDFTLADLVADLRAPTPSAAAELAVPDKEDMSRHLALQKARLAASLRQQLNRCQQRLNYCKEHRVLTLPVEMMIETRRQMVDMLAKDLQSGFVDITDTAKGRLSLLVGRLDALSPLATLARGYSYAYDQEGQILRQADQVRPGDGVHLHLHKGSIKCTVKETTN